MHPSKSPWEAFLIALALGAYSFTAHGAAGYDTGEPKPTAAAGANTDWRWLGGNSEQQQHSALKQINDKNVQSLGLAWAAEMGPIAGVPAPGLVGNPLVADGVVFQSGPLGVIYANDVRTGKSVWTFMPDVAFAANSSGNAFWDGRHTRGLALEGDSLFVASNCRILAVDRKTGHQIWAAQACDPSGPYAIPGAPRAGGGKVFVGNSGGDGGDGRGFVDAFDSKTGRHLWRFWTRPGDPSKPFESPEMKMAAKTWGTDYWNEKYVQGGVRAWDAITYDASTDILYFGLSVPGQNPSRRPPDAGDELFSGSIVAVNASTGKYLWHYQTIQHDGWNQDATMHIMLADLPLGGKTRHVVMTAPKNGFFYVLDAKTGKFISGKNYVPVNWATRIDSATGRPVMTKGTNYWEHPGQQVIPLPGEMGAHNWELMAFEPSLRLVYIPVTIAPIPESAGPDGAINLDIYWSLHPNAKIKAKGELVAWDPVTQTQRWSADHLLPINGGVLATDGNLVFQGTGDGKFEAFAADTGRRLWSYDAQGAIIGAPTTVQIDGVQYILVPSGSARTAAMFPEMMTTTRTRAAPSRLLAFRLDGKAALPAIVAQAPPRPPRPKQPADVAGRGAQLFASRCSGCHGEAALGSTGYPDLRNLTEEKHVALKQIVVGGALRPLGMPAFPSLKDADLESIRAYLINRAWDRYEQH